MNQEKWIVEGKELDANQVNSIFNNHRNNLVVASAGSGKTTTIVGKVKYLVMTKSVNPQNIVCLSFTNKSASELRERIKKEINEDIDVFTFHKLGINIINKNNNEKANYLIEGHYLVIKIIEKLLVNTEYLNNYLKYFYQTNNLKLAYQLFKSEHYIILEHAKLFTQYINEIKQANINHESLLKKSNNKNYQMFIRLLIPIIKEYNKHLGKNSLIDFNDMITIATTYINEGIIKLPYTYIIVDEYQDISLSRYKLIKAIYDRNNSEIFCVGDDYQCIFSYAGSNLEYFVHFDKYFGDYKYNSINKTYRFNQMLANVSNEFIIKNRKQFKKKVDSFFKNDDISISIVEKDELLNILNNLPIHSSVIFLGRYQHDLNIIENNYLFNIERANYITIYYKRRIDLNINFYTVHQSKGLEAHFVFVLNNEKGKLGFPSKKKNTKIQKIILKRDNLLEEERRLFYVAITRAKKKTFLLVTKKKESIFIKEIKSYIRKYKS